MSIRIKRSVSEAIRTEMSTAELWSGEDNGLYLCWEKGREKAETEPSLSKRAQQDELLELCWARGTWNYLAYWQGLRGENLSLDLDHIFDMKCQKTGRLFTFGGSREERLKRQKKLDANKDKKELSADGETKDGLFNG